jgi:hypothetical protein
MVALAWVALEAAAVRVLAALGIAGTGAILADQARKRDEARTRQETGARATTSTAACTAVQNGSQPQQCRDCPPDKGVKMRRTFPVRHDWVDYQARITGMPNGPNFIDEWKYNTVEFDGFVSAQCLLQEAKGGYDRFFDEWGRPKPWWAYNVEEMIKKLTGQVVVAVPRPPVRLEWFWQEPFSYRYFSLLLEPMAPDVIHHYQP